MQPDFFVVTFRDKTFNRFQGDIICHLICNPSIPFDLLVNLDAFFAHGTISFASV